VPPHSRFVVLFDARGRSFPEPLGQKGCFLAAVVLEPLQAASGIFENQSAAISEWDFGSSCHFFCFFIFIKIHDSKTVKTHGSMVEY
jgi:hypothetical protein